MGDLTPNAGRPDPKRVTPNARAGIASLELPCRPGCPKGARHEAAGFLPRLALAERPQRQGVAALRAVPFGIRAPTPSSSLSPAQPPTVGRHPTPTPRTVGRHPHADPGARRAPVLRWRTSPRVRGTVDVDAAGVARNAGSNGLARGFGLFSAHIEPDDNTRPLSAARSRPGCPAGIRVGMGMPTYRSLSLFRAPCGRPCRHGGADRRHWGHRGA
jgi:hypothetical protein